MAYPSAASMSSSSLAALSSSIPASSSSSSSSLSSAPCSCKASSPGGVQDHKVVDPYTPLYRFGGNIGDQWVGTALAMDTIYTTRRRIVAQMANVWPFLRWPPGLTSVIADYAAMDGIWHRLPDLPVVPSAAYLSPTATFLDGSVVIVTHYGMFEEFDCIRQTYRSLSPLPPSPGPHEQRTLVNVLGQLYLCNGDGRQMGHTRDPHTRAWTTLPESGFWHAGGCVVACNDMLYVFGGRGFGDPVGCECFDVTKQTWKSISDMPESRMHMMGGIVLPDHRTIALVGGWITHSMGATTTALLYDTVSDTWSRAPWGSPMVDGASIEESSIHVRGTRVYVAGGLFDHPGGDLSPATATFVLDLASEPFVWRELSSLPVAQVRAAFV